MRNSRNLRLTRDRGGRNDRESLAARVESFGNGEVKLGVVVQCFIDDRLYIRIHNRSLHLEHTRSAKAQEIVDTII